MKNSALTDLSLIFERQRILSSVSLQLSEIDDFKGKSQALVDSIAPLTFSDSIHTYRLNETEGKYVIVSSWYANEEYQIGCSKYSHSMPVNDLPAELYDKLFSGDVVFCDNKLLPVTLPDWARRSVIFGFTALDRLQGILVYTTSRDSGWDELTLEWLKTIASMISSAIRRTFLYDKLQHEVEWRDKIYPIIAHDLRGGVGTIKMLAESALMTSDYSERNEIISMILQGADSNFMLLDNLLKWSRSRNLVNHISLQQTEIISLIDNIINNFVLTAKLKNIELEFVHNPKRYTLEIDEEMIRTVVRNLISNALKFTPSGGKITVSAHEKDEKIEIIVADNGVGMSDKTREILLAENSHMTTYGTDGEKGNGFGLLLVKEFIAANGGVLKIESHEGRGSRFSFIL